MVSAEAGKTDSVLMREWHDRGREGPVSRSMDEGCCVRNPTILRRHTTIGTAPTRSQRSLAPIRHLLISNPLKRLFKTNRFCQSCHGGERYRMVRLCSSRLQQRTGEFVLPAISWRRL